MSKSGNIKLYCYKDQQKVKKILIAANYGGVKIDFPQFEMGKDNLDAAFLVKNPLGKVPVLETAEGCIFESNAIAKYVCRLNPKTGLLGSNDLHASQIDQWLYFCSNEIEPSYFAWLAPILGYATFCEELHKQTVENIKVALKALNCHLERNTFLVGERLSLADIVIASTLVPLYSKVFDPRFRAPFHNTNRWFETVTQQEQFLEVEKLDPTQWCTVAQKAKVQAKQKEAPKEEEKVQPQKEEKKPKEKVEKPKEEKKPKEKKKKEEDEEEEEEEDVEREDKKADPLALLPKSTFVLDAYKREYCNTKLDQSMQYLWDNYDPEGYSMFYAKYKYNEECTASFKSTNLIGGFFQRLEKMHKYAFGTMLVLGEEKKHEIEGFWIFRGQGVPQHMIEDVVDTDIYDWIPINYSEIDAHKERIKVFLAWGNIDGKECLDGKTFK